MKTMLPLVLVLVLPTAAAQGPVDPVREGAIAFVCETADEAELELFLCPEPPAVAAGEEPKKKEEVPTVAEAPRAEPEPEVVAEAERLVEEVQEDPREAPGALVRFVGWVVAAVRAIGDAVASFVGGIADAVVGLVAAIGRAGAAVADGVASVVGGLAEGVAAAGGAVADAARATVSAVAEGASSVGRAIVSVFDGLGGGAKPSRVPSQGETFKIQDTADGLLDLDRILPAL